MPEAAGGALLGALAARVAASWEGAPAAGEGEEAAMMEARGLLEPQATLAGGVALVPSGWGAGSEADLP